MLKFVEMAYEVSRAKQLMLGRPGPPAVAIAPETQLSHSVGPAGPNVPGDVFEKHIDMSLVIPATR